jgi:hypothetical protein
MTVEELLAGDPEATALDELEANIAKAERAYRADPKLAADFQETGWFAERVAAAKRGEAIWSEGRRQAEPAFKFAPQPGQLEVRLSPWAGWTGLRTEVLQQRTQLLEQRRPQLLQQIARVRELGPLVTRANRLLGLAIHVRGPVPRTIRTPSGLAPASYREGTDELELVDAALGGWSLLDPLPPDTPTQVITSGGIERDTSPSPSVAEVRRAHEQAVIRFGTHRG